MRTCIVCGKSYSIGGYKYCSDECREINQKKIMKTHNDTRYTYDFIKNCIDCGADIEKPHKNRKRCPECQRKANMECMKRNREKQKEEKATYHRPVFRQESVLGNESRMSSISEIMRLAAEQGLSYAEYMARRNS